MAAEATPEAGFADGDGDFARFDGPSGLAAAEDGTLFVADTNNHLVSSSTGCSLVRPKHSRMFSSLGLGAAGGLGFVLRFNYPADVSLGTNGTLFVADLHSLRRISMPENPTTVLGVGFDGRVTTAAGDAEPGEADGTGPEARFSRPSGVASTADGAAYLSDAASCRLRRVAP
ncbi:unnamed protein product, partial [Ectocarpus sp. 12 AP-2014]